MSAKVLEIEKLTVNIKKQPICDNLSLTIQQNEIVTIIGDSGAGKTTFLRALNGLVPINEGSILDSRILITS